MFKKIVACSILLLIPAVLMESGSYGLTLFVFIPILAGFVTVALTRPRDARGAAMLGMKATLVGSLAFLAMGAEGLICTMMMLPLSLPLGAFGGWLAFQLWQAPQQGRRVAMLLMLPAGAGSFGWDMTAAPEVYSVTTAVEIDAPREKVWPNVVSFSELPPPEEWVFRTGLAYPVRARIDGRGPDAVRRCEFSTGAFVEPIEVWDEPRLLAFRVTENPPPMQEWSPWREVLPKHLEGYMVSHRGQFRLVELPGGRTRLEGTTWYQHGLWPAAYWRLWSDAIIHRIHLRVLRHVAGLSTLPGSDSISSKP